MRTPLVLSMCTLAACAQLASFQVGGTTGPTAGASASSSGSSPSSSSGGSSPIELSDVATTSDGGGSGGAFCGKGRYGKRTAKELHAWFDTPDEGRHAMHFLIKIHQALCSSDTEASDRAEIASMRKTVLAELGMTEADTRDLPNLLDLDSNATLPGYFATNIDGPGVKGEARASATSPVDQLWELRGLNDFYKTRWVIDAWGDAMTESARAAYIERCVKIASEANGTAAALAYVWCSDDVRHLDRAKLVRELAPLPPEVRFTAKVELGNLMIDIAKLEKQFARDPKLARIAIELPRKVADDWRAFTKANHALVDHVRSVELAWMDHDGEPPDNCRALLAGDWKRAVASAKVSKANAPSLGVAATSRASYLASVGMERCTRKMPGFTGLASTIGQSLDRAPLGRGPRTEAFETAVAELSKGSTKPVNVPRMESYDVAFLPMQQSNGETARFWAHTVAKTVRHGDKIKVSFKKEKVDYAVCTREEPTGNWVIHGNVIERETHCVALRSESTMEAVDPLEMPADLVSWVRPGQAIVVGADDFPIEIWSDVHQKKLLGLYGVSRAQ